MQPDRALDNHTPPEANHDSHNVAQSTPNHCDAHYPQRMSEAPTYQEARSTQQRPPAAQLLFSGITPQMQNTMMTPGFAPPHDYGQHRNSVLHLTHTPTVQLAASPSSRTPIASPSSVVSNSNAPYEMIIDINGNGNPQSQADGRNKLPCAPCQDAKSRVCSKHYSLFQS
jgi:hypothetical protein